MSAKVHILLIEDEKSSCAYIATLLARDGYQITSATTGKEGLSLAASRDRKSVV